MTNEEYERLKEEDKITKLGIKLKLSFHELELTVYNCTISEYECKLEAFRDALNKFSTELRNSKYIKNAQTRADSIVFGFEEQIAALNTVMNEKDKRVYYSSGNDQNNKEQAPKKKVQFAEETKIYEYERPEEISPDGSDVRDTQLNSDPASWKSDLGNELNGYEQALSSYMSGDQRSVLGYPVDERPNENAAASRPAGIGHRRGRTIISMNDLNSSTQQNSDQNGKTGKSRKGKERV